MKKEFLEKLIEDARQYPYGIPEEEQQKWEELTKEEQEQWNELAQTRAMQIHMLAYNAFKLKTARGVPEEILESIFEKKFNFSHDDMNMFKLSFKHFMEWHKIQSRKSAYRFK